ncbi:hypothetical protein ACHAPJ_007972 [Fusarium lateritium]
MEATQPSAHEPQQFTLFPRLPPEIRRKIWHTSLQYQRIIKVYLRMHLVFVAHCRTNGVPGPPLVPRQDDPVYYPVVQGRQTLSKLYRVNRESRAAALSFYRVHLPCWLTKGAAKKHLWTPGTVYYNPEYDFLHIEQDDMFIVDFVQKLKVDYDPRHVGLRNLALCSNQLCGSYGHGLSLIEPSTISPESMQVFKDVLFGLDQVWFVSIQINSRLQAGRTIGWPSIITPFFDRSFPITATPLSFDRIGADPRSIGKDLSNLHVLRPRYLFYRWQDTLEKLDIKLPNVQYRYLLAFSPNDASDIIYDYDGAVRWLKKEDDIWTGNYKRDSAFSCLNLETPAAELPEFRDEDLNAAVRPAIGFWLFPVDAFYDGTEQTECDNALSKWDVKDHWPELALLRMVQ